MVSDIKKAGAASVRHRPCLRERGVIGVSVCVASLPTPSATMADIILFKWLFALLVSTGCAHRVHPTLVQLLVLLHDPFLLSLKLRIFAFVPFPCCSYRPFTGVHMGSSQPLPAFFANFSLSLAPVFFMIPSSSLNSTMVYNPLNPP